MFFNIFKKKQLKTAQFINELYAKLNNCHSLKEISDISISFLSQNLSVSTGLFYILDNQNKQLNLSATYNISAKNLRFNIDLEDSMFIDSLQNKNIKIFNNIENLESKFNIFSPYGMKMAIIPILDEYKNIIAVSQFIYMDSLENYNDISDVLNIIAEHIIKYQKNKENKNYFNLLNKYIITSTTNKDGIINFASDAFCNVSGYTKLELIGKSHNILKHPSVDDSVYKDMWQTIKKGDVWQGELPNLKKDGSTYWVKAKITPLFGFYGDIIGYTSIRQDISNRKLLEKISITDPLTSLYNRRYFDKMFTSNLALSKRTDKKLAFCMIDVDHFKLFNDTYGHQEGDIALKKVAKTLNNSIQRENDLAFRLGGEEFAMLYFVNNDKDAIDIANKTRISIEDNKIQHKKNSASQHLTVSIGLYLCDTDELNISTIYKDTDQLLYEAKKNGRNRIKSNISQ